MPVASPAAEHFLLKLAASKVDAAAGTIHGATVAQSGVRALGKIAMFDSSGALTRDPDKAVKKLPAYTDEKTLDTLMAAAQDAGPRMKVREDHNDAIEARIGYCSNFSKGDGRVSTDIQAFDAYRNRALLFETALKTPDQIGLSIDAVLSYEIVGDKALMRVESLDAVDIVDAGAITHGGLLLKRGVDTPRNNETENQPDHMASPTSDEIMAELKKMGDGYLALTKGFADCQAAIQKLSTPPAPPADAMAAIKAQNEQLAAGLKEVTDKLAATNKSLGEMRRERALLGFRGTETERQKLGAATADEIEQLSAKAKDYLTLVKEARTANTKLSAADAHDTVRKTPEGRAAYEQHLLAKGIATREQLSAA